MCERISRGWTGLALGLLAACSGGGGSGGGSDGGAPKGPAIGGLTSSGYLARVALQDGDVTLTTGQGPIGFPDLAAMALDPQGDVLYGVALASKVGVSVLLRIDPTAGKRGLKHAPVVVGELLPNLLPGSLAWHSGEERLYGVQAGGGKLIPGKLVRIDPATGATELVGECAKVTTLAYDPVTDMLYGVTGSVFYRIDPATGASLDLFQETTYLPKVHALALDPQAGIFHASFHDLATPPGIATIDLFGHVDEVATIASPLADLELDPGSGAMLGLTTGKGIARVEAGAPAYTVKHRGNVGVEVLDVAYDPSDQGYYGLDLENNLVKLWPGGGCRTIGRIEDEMYSIFYDPDVRQVWGLRESDWACVPIDGQTAGLGAPTFPPLSAGTKVAYDTTAGVFRAHSAANGVTIEFDPYAGTGHMTSNAHPLGPMTGLAWDPLSGQLVGMWDPNPGQGGQMRVSDWDPFVSGGDVLRGVTDFDAWAFERHAGLGVYHAFGSDGGDLFEMTIGVGGTQRTVGALRDRYYRSATFVPLLDRVFAIDHVRVWSIDPQTGATELVGSHPDQGSARAIAWDPERGYLGFLMDGKLHWTSTSAPWHSPLESDLGGIDVDKLAYSPQRGLFYVLGDDGLYSVAINVGGAAVVHVSATPPPAHVTGLTWSNGALWATTEDAVLHRVDPDSGAWKESGPMRFAMQGLY